MAITVDGNEQPEKAITLVDDGIEHEVQITIHKGFVPKTTESTAPVEQLK
jgi:hypothetical protein